MLDIKRIRNNPEEVENLLKRRNPELNLKNVLELDKVRREKLVEAENMKAEQNKVSKQVPLLKKEGKDVTIILQEMKDLAEKVKVLDGDIKEIDAKIEEELLSLPNTPNRDVAVGASDADNKEIRRWGEPREFDFELKPHWDLGVNLNILDFERATKITGTRFSMFKGTGARLERAITAYMLDKHTVDHGFTEIAPPFMVNKESMYGTGQLPKFEEDMFKLSQKDYYLIPTAEVPVTNIYRDEVIDEAELPIYMTAYTPCFRAEAGSAGRDTRGLIRNHQFDKVEMVMYAVPEDSYRQLEILTNFAEEILKGLELPYRVVELCTGDIGFSSAKTYDLEVWMPSYNRYVEISSCSNFEDFQARRANIKYRPADKRKLELIHTLNGSGLAVGRTFAAILENYQNEDGSITIPKQLRPYMRGMDKISL
ncbi:serine--tRNA ligase [Sedimentibacter hydroxybenzoicus DSM 7310]|uniref:Serine--tRNA ligase n=1 Tax=Sedimentibacter hydroxybenzoicus DSM 7310 TaxID=1123245 RepID=A0A974BH69_SEDHY|nr:serine--tRNA ligase [Sedimentibacter hydroxybenzoicus]NYB73033.1 serine--tRNA ligase [Sedimentibacter hydroxybenzoicus DSM 7310]